MNYAATQQLCLIYLTCSEKRTSQPLMKPYGVLLDLTSQQTTQMMAVNMAWTEGHSFNASHGYRGSTYGCIFHQYTDYIKHKYSDAIVVFDGYGSTDTKGMTHQRWAKENAGTTVTFPADTPVTMKKEHFLANRQNKQRFIFMLSEALNKNNCDSVRYIMPQEMLIC